MKNLLHVSGKSRWLLLCAAWLVALAAMLPSPVNAQQVQPAQSASRTPEQIEAARKRFFDFIDAAIKNESLTDIAWVERALSVRAVPNSNNTELSTSFQLFERGTSDDVVYRGFAEFSVTTGGNVVKQSANFDIADAESLCITVDDLRQRYGSGKESDSPHSSLVAQERRQQKVYFLHYAFSRDRRLQLGFDFLYRRCLGAFVTHVRT